MNQAQSNNIYYNASIYSDPTLVKTDAKFSVNRVQEIVNKPSNYELAIVRFKIPRTSIPMFYFKDNYWYITLKIGSSEYTETLLFVPNSASTVDRNSIYIHQEFVDIINNAFTAAFVSLNSAHTITANFPPVMTYDPVTKLFNIEVQQNYLADGIEIIFNRQLMNLFSSFQNFFLTNTGNVNYRIIVADRVTNISTLNSQLSYNMFQDFPTEASLSMLQSIRIETDSVPILRELDGAQKDISSSLLTDFNVSSTSYDTSDLIFFPQGPLRYLDLISKYPLNQIDFSVFYVTKDDEKILLQLNSNESLNIKFLFRKKIEQQISNFIRDEIDDLVEEMDSKLS
jgi:hypothetical protein